MLINGGLNCHNFEATEGERKDYQVLLELYSIRAVAFGAPILSFDCYHRDFDPSRDESELLYLGNTISS